MSISRSTVASSVVLTFDTDAAWRGSRAQTSEVVLLTCDGTTRVPPGGFLTFHGERASIQRTKGATYIEHSYLSDDDVYLYDVADTLLVCTNLQLIPSARPKTDRLSLARLAVGCRTSLHHSPLEGVVTVAPGHVARVDRAGQVELSRRPISMTRRHTPDTFDAAVAQLHSLLRSSIDKAVVGTTAIGLTLSGGLDSGMLAHLLSSSAVAPISLFHVGSNSLPTREDRRAAELIAKSINVPLGIFDMDARSKRVQQRLESGELIDPADIVYYDNDFGRWCDASLRPARGGVVVNGFGADHVFLIDEPLRRFRSAFQVISLALLRQVISESRRAYHTSTCRNWLGQLALGLRPLPRPPAIPQLDWSFEWIEPSCLAELADEFVVELESNLKWAINQFKEADLPYDSLASHLALLYAKATRPYWLDSYTSSILRVSPYLSPEVVEYVYSMPPWMKLASLFGRYVQKAPLRALTPPWFPPKPKWGQVGNIMGISVARLAVDLRPLMYEYFNDSLSPLISSGIISREPLLKILADRLLTKESAGKILTTFAMSRWLDQRLTVGPQSSPEGVITSGGYGSSFGGTEANLGG